MSRKGHKEDRVAGAQLFVARYEEQGEDFLDCIVTRDETSVFHHTPENKLQSVQWRHIHSSAAKKFRTLNVDEENHGNCLLGQEGAASRRLPASRRRHKCCLRL